MHTYVFTGIVLCNDVPIDRNHTAVTQAVSTQKARNNIAWRYKQQYNLAGKITLVGEMRKEI